MRLLTLFLAKTSIGRRVQILSSKCGETSFKVDPAMREQQLNTLGQAYLLMGKHRVMRIDAPETFNPIAVDNVRRASAELPAMARSLIEGAGREVARVLFANFVDVVVPCALTKRVAGATCGRVQDLLEARQPWRTEESPIWTDRQRPTCDTPCPKKDRMEPCYFVKKPNFAGSALKDRFSMNENSASPVACGIA
jgi:hypothetical protein